MIVIYINFCDFCDFCVTLTFAYFAFFDVQLECLRFLRDAFDL